MSSDVYLSSTYSCPNDIDSYLNCFKYDRLKEKSQRLVDKAVKFFSQSEYSNLAPVNCPLQSKSFFEAVQEIFLKTEFKGVCIGERHTDWTPKQFLIEHMQDLQILGIKTIFLENIKSDEFQLEYDQWFNFSSESEMPDSLKAQLKYLDKIHSLPYSYSYLYLAQTAKRFKIRLVAIDTSSSSIAGTSTNSVLKVNDRILALNYKAQKIIHSELKKCPEPYIILTGSNHGSRLKDSKIPGLSELLQCPFLILGDTTPIKNEPITHVNPKNLKEVGYKRHHTNTVHAIGVMQKPNL